MNPRPTDYEVDQCHRVPFCAVAAMIVHAIMSASGVVCRVVARTREQPSSYRGALTIGNRCHLFPVWRGRWPIWAPVISAGEQPRSSLYRGFGGSPEAVQRYGT